jgi:hypothetical protein
MQQENSEMKRENSELSAVIFQLQREMLEMRMVVEKNQGELRDLRDQNNQLSAALCQQKLEMESRARPPAPPPCPKTRQKLKRQGRQSSSDHVQLSFDDDSSTLSDSSQTRDDGTVVTQPSEQSVIVTVAPPSKTDRVAITSDYLRNSILPRLDRHDPGLSSDSGMATDASVRPRQSRRYKNACFWNQNMYRKSASDHSGSDSDTGGSDSEYPGGRSKSPVSLTTRVNSTIERFATLSDVTAAPPGTSLSVKSVVSEWPSGSLVGTNERSVKTN